jgi:hypothetical protein
MITNVDDSGSVSISRPAKNASPKSAALRPACFIRRISKRPSTSGLANRAAVDNVTRGSLTPWQAMTRSKREKSTAVDGNSVGQLSKSISNTHRRRKLDSEADMARAAGGGGDDAVMVSVAQ